MRLVIKKNSDPNPVERCFSEDVKLHYCRNVGPASVHFYRAFDSVYSVLGSNPRHPNTFYQYRLTINLCENVSFISPNRPCNESRVIRSRKERPKRVTT